jgi:Rrf2 family protein
MFSQTVEYALRAMMYLAAAGGAAQSGEKIAAGTRVPQGYLSKVMRDLVVAGLVRSFRGPNGGFILARSVGEISILDVVNAVDPIRRIDRCPVGDPSHASLCGLHHRLDGALAIVEQTFRSTTLADVLGGRPGGCGGMIPSRRAEQQGDSHAPAA